MYQLDYHDYKGLSSAEARVKAGNEFDKYIARRTDKKKSLIDLTWSSVKVIVTGILLAIVLASVICNVALWIFAAFHEHSSYSAGSLGLDAAHGVYVADKAGVLNDKVRQQAYDLNKKLERSDYHAQIMVVVVNKVPRKYGSINDYSMAIAEKYKPGDKKQNTGLLYTVAINDHKARLEVGYGLEGKIPDAIAAKLQQPANAHYKDNEYSAGMSALLDGVQQLLLDGKSADKVKTVQSDETDRNPYSQFFKNGWMALFVIIGTLTLFVIILLSSIGMFLLVFYPFIAWSDAVKKLIDDVKEHRSRIENPSMWVARDREDREHAIRTAIDMARHPESYRHSSSSSSNWHSSSDGGSFFSSSSSSGSSGRSSSSSSSSGGGSFGGGSFGGGGATTSW